MSDLETINANLRREIEEARANANGLRAVISGVSDERDNALKELAIHDAEDVDVERGFNAAKAIIAHLRAVIEEAVQLAESMYEEGKWGSGTILGGVMEILAKAEPAQGEGE